MKKWARLICILLCSVSISAAVFGSVSVSAAASGSVPIWHYIGQTTQGDPIHLLVGETKSFMTFMMAGQRWYSKNPNIASVSSGIVRGVKKGTTTIYHYNGMNSTTAYKVTVYTNAKKRYYAEIKSLLKGKWGRNSSEYSNRFYKFSENYIKVYDKKTKKMISKGKITSLSRETATEGFRYNMIIEGNTKLVFHFTNGRFEDAWYYFKQNGNWNYSGSGSFVHLTYK